MKNTMSEAIGLIAYDILSIETLATRNSDELDFHDRAVWNIKSALEAAYMAGAASVSEPKEKPVSVQRVRQSAYDRTKGMVYATGNKWAIENFHATHD